MASQLIASNRENADVVTGKVAIKRKMSELLKKNKFPLGVMPVDEVVELGYNPSTRFLWAIRKKKLDHFFKGINKKATLDTEVTGFLEERRMKKITGVKAKELMIWVSLTDFRIDDPASGKIIFTATAGITKTFPISAFEEDEEEEEKVEVKKVEEKVVEPVKKNVEVKKMEEAKKEVVVKT
ncbi:Transcription repressor MYB4-like [Heracleum sosnowskyi]|uniref:Transcription repressor MYB4-like n=1 Tax=Heracleum sosnowskyi TaxID=360622 RepID=A0AAD8IAA2_9APIA|nr:Transcription repressor MYB4-like [Heracleum sosnowskyi]